MTAIKSSNLGYPRLGEKREWKRALERYWSGQGSQEELLSTTKALRLEALKKQQLKGIDIIPVADFSLYDHILDTSVAFNVIPERFQTGDGNTLTTYFDIARGNKEGVASEMTKWFNTNYHYIVPELADVKPELKDNRWLTYYLEAKEALGIEGKPVIVGPITYLKLGKGYQEEDFSDLLGKFVPVYEQVLKELGAAGVQWVQIDEPYLATEVSETELDYYREVYAQLAKVGVKLELQTYFESVDHLEAVLALPVEAIGLDFIHDHGETLSQLKEIGFPSNKILAAGIIDGRNVWASDLTKKVALVKDLLAIVKPEQLWLQPSNSLLHVPITKSSEVTLNPVLLGGLAFADEKLAELVTVTKGGNQGEATIVEELAANQAGITALNESPDRNNPEVKKAIAGLSALKNERQAPFSERIKAQKAWLKLPLLPTTTIGSFPQSPEVRQKRAAWLKGDLTQAAYDQFIESETARWIEIQEELDIDVLVHGEFERTDMVEYFGQKLAGFQATKFGWVQSYGSRAVRPPLVYGDVAFIEPITVKESVYAQSLTTRPVKGMLTAPVTIINWSFVRDDVPKTTVGNQIGLALRKEVEALEAAGIKIIQVDEPALREGLPLKRSRWQAYLEAAVYSFKLTTTSVADDTQIHTHMCYAEFDDVIETIDALDADVISIEASRSHGEIISTFEEHTYNKEIGLGVYDIHSPRVPSLEEILGNIRRPLKVIPVEQFWINPDCGLKTRKEAETIAALAKLVEATKIIRQEYQNK
ncbi:5-methyltetrahydropteroyltriglutamate--homocysteine S-methyltransferase [Vagococcus sp. BWB3-3]|uniref:5-methyltetrahydropteroyltriglutamate--homocysteine methyltransferase n=1 Tax=Vagococcus allomyrinae TaxID=2794353 RepID=A0A940PDI5_9ENTE|nr:5-methyltetrahydropteroyltriglutamate--homocysteine S-methyltransferase [Vagococcus allomyrinae]MBP1044071.1 5-methyltetrahydropteroyltriglutamate--homocysteine S-methyltransferase [Vagococcus allomyrinae]